MWMTVILSVMCQLFYGVVIIRYKCFSDIWQFECVFERENYKSGLRPAFSGFVSKTVSFVCEIS